MITFQNRETIYDTERQMYTVFIQLIERDDSTSVETAGELFQRTFHLPGEPDGTDFAAEIKKVKDELTTRHLRVKAHRTALEIAVASELETKPKKEKETPNG